MQLLLSASKSVDVVHLVHTSFTSCIPAAGNLCGGNTAVFPILCHQDYTKEGKWEICHPAETTEKIQEERKTSELEHSHISEVNTLLLWKVL